MYVWQWCGKHKYYFILIEHCDKYWFQILVDSVLQTAIITSGEWPVTCNGILFMKYQPFDYRYTCKCTMRVGVVEGIGLVEWWAWWGEGTGRGYVLLPWGWEYSRIKIQWIHKRMIKSTCWWKKNIGTEYWKLLLQIHCTDLCLSTFAWFFKNSHALMLIIKTVSNIHCNSQITVKFIKLYYVILTYNTYISYHFIWELNI